MPFLPFRMLIVAVLIPLSGEAMLLQVATPESPPIRSAAERPMDPVAELAAKLANGEETLEFDAMRGYLPSLLQKLNVPVASQVLVFSKTSLQADRINPRRPRSLYFNDDVYIGWIPTAPLMEIASVDPDLGTVFYTLDQVESAAPQFERRTTECLGCHIGVSTGGVPGLMMRSVYADNQGNALLRGGAFFTTNRSPWPERWGGWYVTGSYGDKVHMGNLVAADHAIQIGRNVRDYVAQLDINTGANLEDIRDRFDYGSYLSPHSDVVALLVLAHQANVHNLITRVNDEARRAVESRPTSEAQNPAMPVPSSLETIAEMLISAMLFTGEPPLAGPVRGTSGFAEQFAASGPRDSEGRSLRELDLDRRLFRYPLSYLIYSENFGQLPDLAKDLIYRRLREILTGRDNSGQFEHLSLSDRTEILEILYDTHAGW